MPLFHTIVIYFLLFLSLYRNRSHDASAISWTFEHKTCTSRTLGNIVYQPSTTTKSSTGSENRFDFRCEDANYMKYILEELPMASGYRREVFELIVSLYKDKDSSSRPIKIDNFDLKGAQLIMSPLGFSIPDEYILRTVAPKSKAFSRVVPGNKDTYYNLIEESEYRQDMSRSLFSVTYKKAGWDCMRHYEILAAGTLPLFIDIDNSTLKSSLLLHPKRLYSKILKFPGLSYAGDRINPMTFKFGRLQFDLDSLDRKLYLTLSAALLQYTRNVFSTQSMAMYLLNTIRNKQTGKQDSFLEKTIFPKSVLYLTHRCESADCVEGDYIVDSLLHGLHSLLGKQVVTDFPRRRALYKTQMEFNYSAQYVPSKMKLYGQGFSYGHLIDDWSVSNSIDDHFNNSFDIVSRKIAKKEYDLIILASAHIGHWPNHLYLWDAICKSYDKSSVVWIHGGDDPLFGPLNGYPSADLFLEQYFPCAGHFFSREGFDSSIWNGYEMLKKLKRRAAEVEGTVIQEIGTKKMHVIKNWKSSLIPDYDTFESLMFNKTGSKTEEVWSHYILNIPKFIFTSIPSGLDLPSIRPSKPKIFHGKRDGGIRPASKALESQNILDKTSFQRPQRTRGFNRGPRIKGSRGGLDLD